MIAGERDETYAGRYADAQRAVLDAADTVGYHRRRGTLAAEHIDALDDAALALYRARLEYIGAVL